MRGRTCVACGLQKEAVAFSKHPLGLNGLQSKCKVCYSALYKDSKRAWKARNREQVAAAERRRQHHNYSTDPKTRLRIKVAGQNRRAKTVGKVTAADWKMILGLWGSACAYCSAGGRMTMDHVVPISTGGLHTPQNVVPACGSCNSRKRNLPLREFLRRQAARLTSPAQAGSCSGRPPTFQGDLTNGI